MYSFRPVRSFSHTQTMPRPRMSRSAPIKCSNASPYLEARIHHIVQRYDRTVLTDETKKTLIIEMLSIVTDKDVTNQQIQFCIRYLNDCDAWSGTIVQKPFQQGDL